jgi:hypothetical protein
VTAKAGLGGFDRFSIVVAFRGCAFRTGLSTLEFTEQFKGDGVATIVGVTGLFDDHFHPGAPSRSLRDDFGKDPICNCSGKDDILGDPAFIDQIDSRNWRLNPRVVLADNGASLQLQFDQQVGKLLITLSMNVGRLFWSGG